MISVTKLLQGKALQNSHSVQSDVSVYEALEVMAKYNVGALMVMEGDQLVGIFSERDYARKGIILGRKAKSTPITEVMTKNVITVTPEMNINDCMGLYTQYRIRHLPVVADGKVVGLLSIRDIVASIMSEQAERIDFLEKYITSA